MTKPTGRPRGRPRKDAAASAVAPSAPKVLRTDEIDDAFIELQLHERGDPRRRHLLRPDEDTLRIVFLLAKLFCTQEEVAGFLGVHRNTFSRFLADSQAARDAWDDGMQHAKISLRRKQLARCDKSDTMNIFLGKQYLGQRDDKFITQTITHTVEELSEAQLMELARQAVPEEDGGLKLIP